MYPCVDMTFSICIYTALINLSFNCLPSGSNGIGSMMQLSVGAFRLSLCLGRIFILVSKDEKKTLTKWRHPGCTGSTFECYFKHVSGCVLTQDDISNSIMIENGLYADESPYIDQKVLRLNRYPTTTGICKICGDEWTGNIVFIVLVLFSFFF
jgi:hypothetical protein